MKKKLQILVLIAILSLCMTVSASAEDNTSDMFAVAQQNVNELYYTGNSMIEISEEVDLVDGRGTYYVGGWTVSTDENYPQGYINLNVLVYLSSTPAIGIEQCDFGIVDERISSEWNMDITWPCHAYILTEHCEQEVAYPVVVPEEETCAVFTFKIPYDLLEPKFVYTNVWGEDENTLAPGGNISTYGITRTSLDFVLVNNLGESITEVYAAPEKDESWGDNLMEGIDPLVNNGRWFFAFNNKRVIENGQKYEFKFVLENGEKLMFSGVDLETISEINIHPSENEEGRYTITCRHEE